MNDRDPGERRAGPASRPPGARSPLHRRAAALIARAGYRPDDPIVLGVQQGAAPPVFLTRGSTSTGAPLTDSTVVYTASLSKQLTAACAALLVRRGELAIDSTLSRWLPELPAWARSVRLRHLVHHTAALPADPRVDAIVAGGPDRTTAAVLRALVRFPALDGRPGIRCAYSNAGYVCLAVAVERAARRPLPHLAQDNLFRPLGMAGTCFWPGPPAAPAGAAPLAAPHPAPLSLGDGGVWATARPARRPLARSTQLFTSRCLAAARTPRLVKSCADLRAAATSAAGRTRSDR